MRTYYLLFLCFFCCIALAQTKNFTATKNNLSKPKTFGKGSIVVIQYDSVIVFDNSNHKESLAAYKTLVKQFTLIKQQYDSSSFYAKDGAAKLSAVSLSLAATVKRTVDSANVILIKTKQDLNQTIASLNFANANLKSVEELLKQEKRANRLRSFSWGVGGFVIGILTTSIILLARGK